MPTWRISNETKRFVNHYVSDLNPLIYISHIGRHRPRTRTRGIQEPQWGVDRRRLAVRNAGARRTAIGVHHHPPRIAAWVCRPPRTPERGGTCRRQDRQLEWKTLLGLDALHARRDLGLLRRPLSARTLEPAMAPVSIAHCTVYSLRSAITCKSDTPGVSEFLFVSSLVHPSPIALLFPIVDRGPCASQAA